MDPAHRYSIVSFQSNYELISQNQTFIFLKIFSKVIQKEKKKNSKSNMVVENEQTTTVFYLSNKMNKWCELYTYKFTDGGGNWNVNREEEIEHDANMEAENEEERANNSMIFFFYSM